MKTSTNLLVVIAVTLAAGCAQPQYGLESIAAQKPMFERHKDLPDGRYYVEILGNGPASYRMLEEHFAMKAKQLCPHGAFSTESERTTRLRGGQLQDIKLDCSKGCANPFPPFKGPAEFPLVKGVVTCNKEL